VRTGFKTCAGRIRVKGEAGCGGGALMAKVRSAMNRAPRPAQEISMSTIRSLLCATALATASLLATGAQASAIFVDNASFETLNPGAVHNACSGAGCFFTVDSIPGWTNSGNSGQFTNASPGYFNFIPDGVTVAYSNNNPISQTVSALAQAGTTYTLLVDFGFRNDTGDLAGMALVVGDHTVAGTGTPLLNSRDWSTYTASYTATADDAGKAIGIVLDTTGAQGDWDNVRLSAVPEPASWALMLTGFFGLGGALRARRRTTLAAA
jgi:hypothetical protein